MAAVAVADKRMGLLAVVAAAELAELAARVVLTVQQTLVAVVAETAGALYQIRAATAAQVSLS